MSNSIILLIEDDGILAMHIEDMLTRMGYTVAGTLASGEEALASPRIPCLSRPKSPHPMAI